MAMARDTGCWPEAGIRVFSLSLATSTPPYGRHSVQLDEEHVPPQEPESTVTWKNVEFFKSHPKTMRIEPNLSYLPFEIHLSVRAGPNSSLRVMVTQPCCSEMRVCEQYTQKKAFPVDDDRASVVVLSFRESREIMGQWKRKERMEEK